MSPHYKRAPIVEAIIDIRVDPITEAPQSEFVSIANTLAGRFPKQNPITAFEMIVDAADPTTPLMSSSGQTVGIRMETEFSARVLQVQKTGFTYSHLAPYSSWDGFKSEAVELWGAFSPIFKDQAIARLAIRTINRLKLPVPVDQVSSYFGLLPAVPRAFPQPLDAYLIQLRLKLPEMNEKSAAIVNSACRKDPEGEGCEITLDFDVFAEATSGPITPEIWRVLDQLRSSKNRLFEASITDRLREMIS